MVRFQQKSKSVFAVIKMLHLSCIVLWILLSVQGVLNVISEYYYTSSPSTALAVSVQNSSNSILKHADPSSVSVPSVSQEVVSTPPPMTTTVRPDSILGCENAKFVQEFLYIINGYRRQNGLNDLTIETNLNLTACDHAKWMEEQGVQFLSHTGMNNSSPVDRCAQRLSYCDAENVAVSYPDNSPHRIFELYKLSSGHNANMLGDHRVIGIAWAGNHQVTVFR